MPNAQIWVVTNRQLFFKFSCMKRKHAEKASLLQDILHATAKVSISKEVVAVTSRPREGDPAQGPLLVCQVAPTTRVSLHNCATRTAVRPALQMRTTEAPSLNAGEGTAHLSQPLQHDAQLCTYASELGGVMVSPRRPEGLLEMHCYSVSAAPAERVGQLDHRTRTPHP